MATQITYAQRHELVCPPLGQASSGAVLLYNHIPKCGGLSLTHMLRQCYASSCDVHQNIFEPRATPLDRDFYHGHGVSGIEQYLPEHKKYFYITILRHPWSLAQSLVRFFSWLTPLDPFYQQEPEKLLLLQEPNILTHYLGQGDLDIAKENLLHKYVFFGLQEFFPASLELLAQTLPKVAQAQKIAKNVSTKEPWHISETTKEAFFVRNALDIELYTMAKEEFLRRAGIDNIETSDKNATKRVLQGATPPLTSSNTQGSNFTTISSLKESIALNEDLPAMDTVGARFENWLHILVHSAQSEEERVSLYQWLCARVTKRASCLYFAHICAQNSTSPALVQELPALGRRLFAQCRARDPQNSCRIVIECGLSVLSCAHERHFFGQDKVFDATAYAWLKSLQMSPVWQSEVQSILEGWESTLSPLAKLMLQSHAQKIQQKSSL